MALTARLPLPGKISPEAYLFPRNDTEVERLELQHAFMRDLAGVSLFNPIIDTSKVTSVADVGTGTGTWLRNVVADYPSAKAGRIRLVGFDICPDQFPAERGNIEFVAHDGSKPFPTEYHGQFDVVNVRLLTFAIKAAELDTWVQNVGQLLRPGGYLQWLDIDATDLWWHHNLPEAERLIRYMVAEKIARGLTPSLRVPLCRAIQNAEVETSGLLNPMTRGQELFHVVNMESLTSFNHPSEILQQHKKAVIRRMVINILRLSKSRLTELLQEDEGDRASKEILRGDADAMDRLLSDFEDGRGLAQVEVDLTGYCIVARKALARDQAAPWMQDCFPIPSRRS